MIFPLPPFWSILARLTDRPQSNDSKPVRVRFYHNEERDNEDIKGPDTPSVLSFDRSGNPIRSEQSAPVEVKGDGDDG